jgi:hypothetical protein
MHWTIRTLPVGAECAGGIGLVVGFRSVRVWVCVVLWTAMFMAI